MVGALAVLLIAVGCERSPATAVETAGSAATRPLIDPPTARYVRFEQVTEWQGKDWASVAEFGLIDATGAPIDRAAWSATADSAAPNDGPPNAIDGNPGTFWHSRWDDGASPPPHALVIRLPATVRISGFRYLPRQDRSGNGTYAQYRLYVSEDGHSWGQPVATGDFRPLGQPSDEKVVVFARQTPNRVPVVAPPAAQESPMGGPVSLQLSASDADGDPIAYAVDGLPPGLSATPTGRIVGTPITPGRYTPTVKASDGKGESSAVGFTWTVLAPSAAVQPVPRGFARYVRLEEVTEVNGKPWAAMAEFNLIDDQGADLPRARWRASADSSDTSDQPGNAIDGSPTSLWHSQWSGVAPPPPHSFIVDLGAPVRVRGFRYLPRQDGLSNGNIARFRFYMSADGVDWGTPVAEGDFSQMGPAGSEKTVRLK